MKYLSTYLILLPFCSVAQQHTMLGVDFAKSELRETLTNKKERQVNVEKVVGDKQTAIAIAEPILFKIYGKNQIISERPYEIYFIDGYWILSGTIPVKSLGGGFLIIMDSKNGKIIKLTHYK